MVRGLIWEKVAGWQALVLNLRVGRSCDQVLWRVHSYLQMFLHQHRWQFKFSTLLWKVQLVHSVSVFPRCSMKCATRFPYNNSPWLKIRNEVDTMSECRVPTALLARLFSKLGSHKGLLTPKYYNLCFSLVFIVIALHPINSPLPFSTLSMLDCPIDFMAATTLKWGGEVNENKDVRDWKFIFNKHNVSTLFAWDCWS